MKKINKYFYIFSSIILALSFSLAMIVMKLFPLSFSAKLNNCQTILKTFTEDIPCHIGVYLSIIGIVFIGGSCIRLFYLSYQIHKMKRYLHMEQVKMVSYDYLIMTYQLKNKVIFIESEKLFAFCFGLFSPKIYISTTMLKLVNKKELEAILLHERYHLDNKDALTMLVATIARFAFPFFPLLHDLLRNYRIEREVAADMSASTFLHDKMPLISVLKKMLCAPSVSFIASAAIADDILEPRIKMLIQKKQQIKSFHKKNIIVSIVSVGLLLFTICAPISTHEIYAHDRKVIVICLHNESKKVINNETNTSFPYSHAKLPIDK